MFQPPLSDYSDAELLGWLTDDGFTGPRWDRFVEHLATHGMKVLPAWTLTGRVLRELRSRNILTGGYSSNGITRPDAEDISADAVTRAVGPYREMLAQKRWDPDGPASLGSAFITGCLYQFPNAYQRWRRRERAGWREVCPGDDEVAHRLEERRQSESVLTNVPQDWAIGRQYHAALQSLLPDDLRGVLQLALVAGWTFKRAARELGHNPEKLWRRFRRELGRPELRGWWQEQKEGAQP